MLTSFNAALSVTSSYTSLPRPFMACPTLYIHLGTSRPFRTATTRRIYKNTVKDKVRMAIIKNPRLERKKFIILTSTLTIYPVIQDITKSLSLPYRQGDCLSRRRLPIMLRLGLAFLGRPDMGGFIAASVTSFPHQQDNRLSRRKHPLFHRLRL